MDEPGFLERLIAHYLSLAAALAAIAVVLMTGMRLFGERSIAARFPALTAIVDIILAPLAVLLVGSLARVAAGYLGFEDRGEDIQAVTILGAFLVGTYKLARIVEVFFLMGSSAAAKGGISGLLRVLFYGAFLLTALLIYLHVEGRSITGVWFSTGVVAALLGFALQKTLGDLFSGIALSIERPFRLGEWLELRDGSIGQVIDINWRSTRLRGWDNATHIVPNSELAGQGFKNLHGTDHVFAPWYMIKIPSEVEPRFAKALLLEAALKCRNVLKQPLPLVRIADASTVPYTYMVWVHFRNYPAMFAGREELFREVHYALKSAGVQTAPEIREWHTRKAPISTAEPPNIFLALKSVDIISELTDEEMQQVATTSYYKYYESGATILREGEVAEAFEVIVSGIVDTAILLNDGSAKVVEQLYPGEYFGIVSMTTAEPSFVKFSAQTDVTVIRVSIGCMRTVLAANPGHADLIAAIVKRRMDAAEQVRAANQRPTPRWSVADVLRRIENSLVRPAPKLRNRQ